MNSIRKNIIITGASSGIGAAIAEQYACEDTKLFLFGRDENRLFSIASLCKMKGAKVVIIKSDVRDKKDMENHLKIISRTHNIDVVIAGAGVSLGTLNQENHITEKMEIILDTNINGVVNTIMPLMEIMINQRNGNIVILSSMAGLIGLASSPSYSASKSAVITFGEALRGYFKRYNVNLSVVIAGYVDTPMTKKNNFRMFFMIDVKKAARKIIRGVKLNKPLIIFPLAIYYLIKIIKILPTNILDIINSKIDPNK